MQAVLLDLNLGSHRNSSLGMIQPSAAEYCLELRPLHLVVDRAVHSAPRYSVMIKDGGCNKRHHYLWRKKHP